MHCSIVKYSLIIFILTSTSCGLFNPASESAMRVKGHIVFTERDRDSSCSLEVWSQESILFIQQSPGILDTRSVKIDFDEDFVIGPDETKYFFVIACQGYPNKFKSNTFTIKGKSNKPIDLGEININGGKPANH